MATIRCAHTVPVNPPGTIPVLTEAQVFKGFQRKIRRPQDFVPAIAECSVLSDDGGVVERKVTFKQSGGHPHVATEVCTELPPHRVDFEMDNGSTVLNIISAGSSGEATDLYVTYVFAWKHDDLGVGSAAYQEAEAGHKKVAKMAVESSIATTRRLVSEGEIQ
ncbi:hypothetical protein SEUCBS139899_009419 [Sporothrix eucalyptigena]|uniref:DUF1857-domain-containing protein n=1 Tax=Sporothrix eucalyptigena TaxID=1812306 RepID=A0ABP0CI67_9PEZI